MAKDEKRAEKKKSGGGKIIFLMILFGCFVPFGVPTLLVCLGLLPTLIALFTETDSRHSVLATIGYMNFAGVLPFIIELWQKNQTMGAALSIVRDPYSWVVMLGAAGIGQLILFTVPPAIASIVINKQKARLETLREGLVQLEAIWGADVGTSIPLEAVRVNRGNEEGRP